MFTKRMTLIVFVASAVMLAVGIGPRFTETARALLPSQQPAGATIPYPGRLTDEDGQPVADGAYDFTFALYAAESGREPVWTEAQEDVAVQGGVFTALLGSVAPLPQETLDGSARWLEVAVRGPGEAGFTLLSPRQELSAAASVSPASPSAGPACAHDHLYENWAGSGTVYALPIVNSNSTGDGIRVTSYATSADNAAVVGSNLVGSGTGVHGLAVAGRGVYGVSNSGTGVSGKSTDGTGVYGKASAPNMSGVYGINDGLGVGVTGNSSDGIGVEGYSGFGTAILASGNGIISSTADSILYLSPHDMVAREADTSVISLTLLDNGGVRVRNMAGGPGSVTRYLVIPVSTFGTLFGSPLYVKSLEVCYKAPATATFIDATGVYKNLGSDAGWGTYIEDTNNRDSTTYACYTANAATPRQAINNSTWMQFNMVFANSGSGWDIYVYTVKLTLTESQN